MEANIVLIKCGKARKTFGARIQKMKDGDWVRTWAFEINEKQAVSEGYDKTSIQGSLNATSEYPGCPYCKTNGFFQCVKCRKINCYRNEEKVTCVWCGNSGGTTPIDQFDIESSNY